MDIAEMVSRLLRMREDAEKLYLEARREQMDVPCNLMRNIIAGLSQAILECRYASEQKGSSAKGKVVEHFADGKE